MVLHSLDYKQEFKCPIKRSIKNKKIFIGILKYPQVLCDTKKSCIVSYHNEISMKNRIEELEYFQSFFIIP